MRVVVAGLDQDFLRRPFGPMPALLAVAEEVDKMHAVCVRCGAPAPDLNLTDMECCYKVFRRDVIQRIDIQEERFGFEPEIVAKVAQMRLRIFEVGVWYYGRTYAEGKKIGFKDGIRALYCICHYNAHKAPLPIQLILYLFIGGISAVANFLLFMAMFHYGLTVTVSAIAAYFSAALVNYFLCILLLFRHRARWNSATEVLLFLFVVFLIGILDLATTKALMEMGSSPAVSKLVATATGLLFNFLGRRFLVFPNLRLGLGNLKCDKRDTRTKTRNGEKEGR